MVVQPQLLLLHVRAEDVQFLPSQIWRTRAWHHRRLHDGAHDAASAAPGPARHVALLVVDDLRTDVARMTDLSVPTPNLLGLANSPGTVTLDRSYVQQGVCSPSRNSFLTARRPDTTRVWNFKRSFRDLPDGGAWVSLPQAFKNAGYLVSGMARSLIRASPRTMTTRHRGRSTGLTSTRQSIHATSPIRYAARVGARWTRQTTGSPTARSRPWPWSASASLRSCTRAVVAPSLSTSGSTSRTCPTPSHSATYHGARQARRIVVLPS